MTAALETELQQLSPSKCRAIYFTFGTIGQPLGWSQSPAKLCIAFSSTGAVVNKKKERNEGGKQEPTHKGSLSVVLRRKGRSNAHLAKLNRSLKKFAVVLPSGELSELANTFVCCPQRFPSSRPAPLSSPRFRAPLWCSSGLNNKAATSVSFSSPSLSITAWNVTCQGYVLLSAHTQGDWVHPD